MAPIVFLSVTASRRGVLAFARRGPPHVVVRPRRDHDDHELATVVSLLDRLPKMRLAS